MAKAMWKAVAKDTDGVVSELIAKAVNKLGGYDFFPSKKACEKAINAAIESFKYELKVPNMKIQVVAEKVS